jgi:AAHS family 4-hydroxybenzoate transporter-like MFS transporter
MTTQRLDIKQVIDDGRFSGYQVRIFALCFLLALLDGYDAQALGAIGPAVIQGLRLTPAEFGAVFSLGGIGVLVGTLVFGMLADRFGRKMMLVASAVIFGVFSIMMALSTSGQELTIYRFLSAIGLGGAVPNALALAAESSPKKMRASMVTLWWAALPAGGMAGSFLGAWLLPTFGWPSVYIVGGVLPLIIALMVLFLMPESLAFLVAMGRDRDQAARILARIAPNVAITAETEFYSNEAKLPGVPVKHLFSGGRAGGTLLLWLLFIMSFCSMLTIVAWSSNMVRASGATLAQASAALGWFNVGSLTASVTVGALIDRFGPFRILTIYFLAMAAVIGCLGFTLTGPFALACAMFVGVGFFTGGSNSGIMALGTLFYPVSVRGTGLGWAYAWGRVGATIGPMIGGLLIQGKWDVSLIYLMIGVPAVIAAATTLVLRSLRAPGDGDAVPAAA